MGAGRDLGLRDSVIAAAVIAAIAFALIELTGSDIDKQAGQTLYTAFALVLFTIIGSTGVALARLQPRFALFGAVTAILAPLAFGATVVSLWSNGLFVFGFGFSGTGGTVGGITVILTITAAAICVLLATVRAGEDHSTRLVRVAGIGALALFVATVVPLLLRLLPIDDDETAQTAAGGVVT